LTSGSSPPSSPHALRGRDRIAEYLRDVCGRDIESRIEDEVLGKQRVAFNEECRYPDGTRVLTATTLEVRDGGFSRQVSVEA